ncbi:hypothetical protein [Salmonella phage PVPSE1]|uniref:Uncharacterized protein 19 n=2 Tax=Seunavirus TaxID=1914851 RepID=G3BLN4_9CAUD|nr:hypothetical protein PVP-SE1_gp018 [Salmonella phage PVPSE1]YP_009148864.1 hypothetical protein ACQ19_gp068 [Salmonella phage SSE121]ADP02414.1 hypothetical protein [Salmonella phage PVPSE1]AFU63709.1 hypothetical protein [Salmonella phage SSE121]
MFEMMLATSETKKSIPVGNVEFTNISSSPQSWTVPANVEEVSVLCVGQGGAAQTNPLPRRGGAGGDLVWRNNIPVFPGEILQVFTQNNADGTTLVGLFRGSVPLVAAGFGSGPEPYTGQYPDMGDAVINKGGAGGNNTSANDIKRCSGAGGAAGYIGKGGDGGNAYPASTMYSQGQDGQGGGGGGSCGYYFSGSTSGENSGGGGGVGIYGVGVNGHGGRGGYSPTIARGGSGGADPTGRQGGKFGGGAGHGSSSSPGSSAVRIIWGNTEKREFPNNARKV